MGPLICNLLGLVHWKKMNLSGTIPLKSLSSNMILGGQCLLLFPDIIIRMAYIGRCVQTRVLILITLRLSVVNQSECYF